MRRFDLGMSLNYCNQWGIVEAVREFFQNAYDAEVVNSENKMYFDYDLAKGVLRIGNENGLLNTNTLLLGSTTKADDEKTIGKHGEGYKVATVVLLRNNKQVKIYNRAKKEVWTAKVIKSRRYNANVVVFDIEKLSIFNPPVDKDLVFEVEGITVEEYQSIVESNLYLQNLKEKSDYISTKFGRVLTNPKFAGKLYVGGLYVTTSKYAKLGYDFTPSIIKLDRDRSFIDGLDLQFLCGKLISATNDINFIRSVKKTWDGSYLRIFLSSYCTSDYITLYDEAYEEFQAKNGLDAIPTTSTSEFNQLKRNGYNAVMVSESEHHFITNARSYSSAVDIDSTSDDDLADELESWFKDNIDENSDLYNSGIDIITKVLCRLRD